MTPSARTGAPIALTMGDPAGIGIEIAIKAWQARDQRTPMFVLVGDSEEVGRQAEHLQLDVSVRKVDDPMGAERTWPQALPVIHQPLGAPVNLGRPSPDNGPAVVASIDTALALTRDGQTRAMVTNPINKKVLYDTGFTAPGHTEYIAQLCRVDHPVMMLSVDELRVVPITVHVPLAEVAKAVSADTIVRAGTTTAEGLQRQFGIRAPRLAVAGLNPHAGEAGAIGREEFDVIAPAVKRLQAAGIDASGPYPADSLFHAAARKRYDAVICMYHDQALIPLKTVNFDEGVNVTLGLPIVRTSPDHGTAEDIAGKGKANPASLLAALNLAARMVEQTRRDPR